MDGWLKAAGHSLVHCAIDRRIGLDLKPLCLFSFELTGYVTRTLLLDSVADNSTPPFRFIERSTKKCLLSVRNRFRCFEIAGQLFVARTILQAGKTSLRAEAMFGERKTAGKLSENADNTVRVAGNSRDLRANNNIAR